MKKREKASRKNPHRLWSIELLDGVLESSELNSEQLFIVHIIDEWAGAIRILMQMELERKRKGLKSSWKA